MAASEEGCRSIAIRAQTGGELHSRTIENRMAAAKPKKARRFVRIASNYPTASRDLSSREEIAFGRPFDCAQGSAKQGHALAPPEERPRSKDAELGATGDFVLSGGLVLDP